MLTELSPRLYHWFIRPEWFNRRYLQKILPRDLDFQGKKILDFGCGIGSSCFLFNPANYLGLDKDVRRIEYARKSNPDYSFQIIKDNHIDFKEGCFDVILVIAVLHHIKAPETLIQEFHRLLKPDGQVLVMEPCKFPDSPLPNLFMELFDAGKYIKNRDGYLNIFGDNNFKINKVLRLSKLFYQEIFFSVSRLSV